MIYVCYSRFFLRTSNLKRWEPFRSAELPSPFNVIENKSLIWKQRENNSSQFSIDQCRHRISPRRTSITYLNENSFFCPGNLSRIVNILRNFAKSKRFLSDNKICRKTNFSSSFCCSILSQGDEIFIHETRSFTSLSFVHVFLHVFDIQRFCFERKCSKKFIG